MRRTGIGKVCIRKAGALLLAAALLTGSLAGCGRGEESEESRPREIVLTGVLAPKAEFQTVNYDLQSLWKYVWWGDSLIWQVSGYDKELRQGRSTWMMADMAGLEDAQPVAVEDGVRSIADLFTDRSGNLYLFGWEYGSERCYLQKKDASWQEIYTVYPQVDAEKVGGYEGFADSEGNVVLTDGYSEKATIIDSEGNWKGNVQIEIPAWDLEFLDGGPDGVFLAATDTMEDKVQLQKVSFEDGTLGLARTVELPRQGDGVHYLKNAHAVLLGGSSRGLLLSEEDALSYFDLQGGRGEKILDWNLLEIDGTLVSEIRLKETADEKPEFEVFLAGGDYYVHGFEPEIAHISWVDEGYLPEKQTLIVGEGLAVGALDLVARRFNRSSENYRVEVEAFGYVELENVVKAGGSVPDIIDVHVIDMALLKDKQLLEDLGPWLKKSKVISREEITDAAYEAGVLDGKLYGVVSKYSIVGLVTSGNAIGMEGFGMEDYAAKAAENPNARVVAPSNVNNLCRQTLSGMMDRFVDWKKGKCKFQSKEFLEYLSLLKGLNPDLQNTGGDNRNKFHSGVEWGTVVYDLFYCTGPTDFYNNITQKEGGVEMISLPTRNREAFYWIYPQAEYAMYADSKCKEGAWAFLEFLLSEEQQSWSDSGHGNVFPANRAALKRYLTSSAAEEEEDEEEMEKAREAVSYMLEHAHPSQIDGRNSEIYYIVVEELEAFLRGQKSAEDTADVIQRRATLYMDEHLSP